MSRDSFRLRTAAGWLTGLALLRDMFTSINNRSGGFEHVLRRRSKSFRPGHSTTFDQRNGEQERARRLRQLQKRGMVPVVYVGPATGMKGAPGIARNFDGKRVSIQDFQGWHPSNAAHWAVR